MNENINFISAAELPEATGEEVSVLCLENGEMKQKPANGLGGGEKPDMVITVTGKSNVSAKNGNYTITEGSVDSVFAAFHAGRYPIVKIRYYDGTDDAYMTTREEYNAYVCTYGGNLWFAYITTSVSADVSLYYHRCYMNSDGTMGTASTYKVTLTAANS